VRMRLGSEIRSRDPLSRTKGNPDDRRFTEGQWSR
jgi:hypothetical protein